MDIASGVYTLTLGIMNYVSEQEDRHTIAARIRAIVGRISSIITPLTTRRTIDPIVQDCLQDLVRLLEDTQAHLRRWTETRSSRVVGVVNPWLVTHQLREDREELMQGYALLVGAINLDNSMNGYRFVSPRSTLLAPPEREHHGEGSPSSSRSVSPMRSLSPLRASPTPLTSSEANDFWEKYFDDEVADSDEFCEALSKWLGRPLNDTECKRLLLRLDIGDTGHVAYSRFEECVGAERLKHFIALYSADPPLPLLIWVDDSLDENSTKAQNATSFGVTVVQLSSTYGAKAWINANYSFLKQHDDAAHIRFISDQNRRERTPDGGVVANPNAGQEILDFIRGEGFKAPFLISTSRKSIHLTKYVESYQMAGSMTANYPLFLEYVSSLAAGIRDDTRWMRYNA
ncbi:unnamed protein product [Cyclocybe aegerita]|uniref:Uncharacterized protein n=1 Tax=Cyclocybe aegerita TaxID=1973307 RepID=A0A8S0VUQ6_CYCAE|nr:unnamed protein product [Cyclocybe aegerita]